MKTEQRTTEPSRVSEYIRRDTEAISPSLTRSYPFVMARGRGCLVWDTDGTQYLDFTAGIAVTSTGHSHPEVVQAIKDQADKFIHMSGTDFYYMRCRSNWPRSSTRLSPDRSPSRRSSPILAQRRSKRHSSWRAIRVAARGLWLSWAHSMGEAWELWR